MKLWRWFVGQVARLRRSIAGVAASGWQPLHADDHVTSADEPAPGPPAHWVERVRRGAPGLLEPSLRRRGGPVEPPAANRSALSQAEPAPERESLEGPEHDLARPEPPVAPERPEAPVRAPLLRKARGPLLQRVLRRPSAPDGAAVEASPPRATKHVSHERDRATRLVNEPAGSPVAKPEAPLDIPTTRVAPGDSSPVEPDRRRLVGKTTRTAVPAPPVPDKPERPPSRSEAERSPRQAEVVELHAPPLQRRAAGLERAASPQPTIENGVTRPSATNVLHADLGFTEPRNEHALEPAVRAPAPRRSAERLREPLVSPQESSVDLGPRPRRRAEPLPEVDVHPWPELPPPLDPPDSDVEAALRAWEHQRRLDREQTRL